MFFGIRDPRSGIRDGKKPGSGINIPDPQHWYNSIFKGTVVSSKKKMGKKVSIIAGLIF
jgi:hypothetical protein